MPTATRPNVLWISFEDTSPRFGCYGDKVARTPHVDRLAREGVIFPNTFSTAPVCAPARSAIITGRYAIANGSHHMRTTHTNRFTPEMCTPYAVVPPHYVKCFPEYLRAAGYYCTNNEKTDYQFPPPLTAWDECGPHAHWRKRPDSSQRFFAVFNLNKTHESGMWQEKNPNPRTDPASVTLPPYLPDTLECRKALARQYDHIADNDVRVGELLRELEEDGLADSTIVFIWSDHGEGLPRSKRWPYDGGLRVPMIVRWPGGLAAGGVDQRLVSTLDLAPTVLSLCGVAAPLHLQGQPFIGPLARQRDYVFASRDRFDESYDMVRAARDGRYKYIRHFRPELPYLLWIPYRNRHPIMREMWRLHALGQLQAPRDIMFRSRPPEELYDTQADPFEIHNLAGDPAHAAALERLRTACEAWRRDVGDQGEINETEMVERMWPNHQQPVTAAPILVPLGPHHDGIEPTSDGRELRGPVFVQMHSATQGASIAYTFETGESPHWLLYSQPVAIKAGKHCLRARAVRIGYADSAETTATLAVRGD